MDWLCRLYYINRTWICSFVVVGTPTHEISPFQPYSTSFAIARKIEGSFVGLTSEWNFTKALFSCEVRSSLMPLRPGLCLAFLGFKYLLLFPLNPDSRFPHIVGRMGKLEAIDTKYFLASALDFFRNQVSCPLVMKIISDNASTDNGNDNDGNRLYDYHDDGCGSGWWPMVMVVTAMIRGVSSSGLLLLLWWWRWWSWWWSW